MKLIGTTRRNLLVGVAGLTAGSRTANAALTLPTSPVSLNIVDAGGALQMVRAAIENYRHAHPNLVSHIGYSTAPPPELPGKLKAQQSAGHVDIDAVLGSNDTVSPGIEQSLWVRLLPEYAGSLPDLKSIYKPGAWDYQQLVEGQAVCLVWEPGGPLLAYAPERVKQPPASPQDLLEWARANRGRFLYARPANSGPGRCFVQAMPYMLGDKDPKDPVNGWDNTWSYLRELGKNVRYYATGTVATLQSLAEESCDMIASQTGWDLNSRALGVVPADTQACAFKNFRWIMEANFIAIPKGVSQKKLAVLLDMTSYLLTKPAQALTYDSGYFYPAPAVKEVPLGMAPAKTQSLLKPLIRPFLADLFKSVPTETPVSNKMMVYIFQRWDQTIGANVGR